MHIDGFGPNNWFYYDQRKFAEGKGAPIRSKLYFLTRLSVSRTSSNELLVSTVRSKNISFHWSRCSSSCYTSGSPRGGLCSQPSRGVPGRRPPSFIIEGPSVNL